MLSLSPRSLALIAIAALLSRVLVAAVLGLVGTPERWEYDTIAAHIAAGNGHVYEHFAFVYAAYAPPLWSMVLALLRIMTGDAPIAIQILQALLCLGAAAVCGGLARRISGEETVGLLAGILVAVQPSLLYYSVAKSDPLPLNAFLLSLIASAGIGLASEPNDRRALAFGCLTGLGILSRGTPVAALPVVAFALILRRDERGRRAIAVSTIAVGLCIAPWLLRNVAVVGAPILTSTTGENFWRGNHEGAGGGVRDLNGGEITQVTPLNPALPPSLRAVLASGSEIQRHDAFMSEAWRFIRTEPLAAMRLFVTKMRIFWWRIDSDPLDYPRMASITYAAIYRSELALALLGSFLLFRSRDEPSRPRRSAASLVAGIMIAVSLLQSAFYVQGRHRFLIEPLLLVFTALGAGALVRGRRAGRASP
ncbi:MAG: glycosyltransferase family 39 protein [Vicinamibacteria bacterium]|nr:glycosyltransferase family 39 protein [Vicinamibacteria bacterium]